MIQVVDPLLPDEIAVLKASPSATGPLAKRLIATIEALQAEVSELSKGVAAPVIEAGIAALHATANADGKVYVVDCAAWDKLEAALRPFMEDDHPELPLMSPTISHGVTLDDIPEMKCPRCRVEMSDLDGFGVLFHAACGFCQHASIDDGVCGFCKVAVRSRTP